MTPYLRSSVILLGVSLAAALHAQVPDQISAQQFGTPTDDGLGKLAVDSSGYCYMAGKTNGDMSGKNAGKGDVIVAKYDASGKRLWLSQFGTTEDDQANAIIIDADGNSYVVGDTKAQLGCTHFGRMDAFVAKIDATGKTLWSEQFGTDGAESAQGLVLDAKGNLYVTGSISAKPADGQKNSPANAFISKIDKAGHCEWTRQWGTEKADSANDIAIDAQGCLYVTGLTAGDLGGQGSAGKIDMFVSKLDEEGKVLWSKQFGTKEPDMGMHITIDAEGAIYVAGSSGGDFASKQVGQGDSVLLKLSKSGDLLWKKQFGTTGWDGIHAVRLSPKHGGVIVSGCQAYDKCEGFLREFDSAGNELWQRIIKSEKDICGQQTGLDASGFIYLTGITHAAAFGAYEGTGNDCVLVKFAPAVAAKK